MWSSVRFPQCPHQEAQLPTTDPEDEEAESRHSSVPYLMIAILMKGRNPSNKISLFLEHQLRATSK